MMVRFPDGQLVQVDTVDSFVAPTSAAGTIGYYSYGVLRSYTCTSDAEMLMILSMIADGLRDHLEYLECPTLATANITGIVPATGSVAGRELVQIDGTGFRPNGYIKFDGTLAFKYSYISSTMLAVWTPPHSLATVDVVYGDSRGTDTLAASFSYS